ncbi:MAG TPA: endonuclease III, partial [Ignavibacteria bacterium]
MQKITEIIALLEKNLQGVNAKRSRADPLDVLIATMLSQNTTDKTSYRAFMNLKSDIGSWDSVLKAPLSKIRKAIRICGLTNQKAKNIKRLLSRLKNERGELSLNYLKPLGNDEIYEDLIKYNGIGTKTISCVLAFGLGRDVFPVDTHVHRLSNRLGLVKTKSPDKTFEQVQKEIPKGKKF